MGDREFSTIYAITLENPNKIGTMVASTPTGRRGRFYEICTSLNFNQDPELPAINTKQKGYVYDTRKYNRPTASGWKEFHIPTMANPDWGPEMEKEQRRLFTQVEYEHEVLAEFGSETVGVFNKDYIDEAASKGYPFEERPRMNAPIAIGIDFDKYGSESNIVVLQWDPHDQQRPRPELGETDTAFGRFKVINHIEIPKSDMHYDVTVETIKELDDRYNPFAIYPDRGAGEYQIEMLRKSLGEKVKGVFYGSSIDVRDPISRRVEKKPLKPFLVNQTTLLLERGKLRIPPEETSEVIKRQMTNFQVVRVSQRTQTPVYSSTDEHGLDAMIFALYAFIEEYPELIDTIERTDPARKMGVLKQNQIDPLKQLIQDKSQNPSSDTSHMSGGHSPAGMRTTRRGSNRTGLSQGWGKRGSLGRKPIRRRGF